MAKRNQITIRDSNRVQARGAGEVSNRADGGRVKGKANGNKAYRQNRSKATNLGGGGGDGDAFSLEDMDYGPKFGLKDIRKAKKSGASDNEISAFVKTLESDSLTRSASNMYTPQADGNTKQNEDYETTKKDADQNITGDETYNSRDALKLISFFQSQLNREKPGTKNVRGDVKPSKTLDARSQSNRILEKAGIQDFNTTNDFDALIDFYSQKNTRVKDKEKLNSFDIGPKKSRKFDQTDFENLLENNNGKKAVGNYAESLSKGDVTKAMERLLKLNKTEYES